MEQAPHFDWSLSKQPLYLQLATVFRRRIETGLWPRGEQVPTLDMLMREFDVGRVTVRSAMAELEAEGLLLRTRGKGTFIRELPADAPQKFVVGMRWDELVARGNLNELTVSLSSPPAKAQPLPDACGQPASALRYVLLDRVYAREGLRVCHSRVYLEQGVHKLIKRSIQRQAVITVLGSDARIAIRAGRQRISLTTAGDDTARSLQIPVGSPIAEITRSLHDASGALLYWARVHYDARYILLDVDLFA